MEPDVPENRDSDRDATEMTSLLSDVPGAGNVGSRRDEVDSAKPSENRPHPHPYHLKNKYTFRSDSVYSDVVPISAAPSHQSSSQNKSSESREKSGSLSSLKAKESKWMTLKKKLGRLNSQPSSLPKNSEKSGEEKKSDRPAKSIHEKRSLFQRAKTLAILPVNKSKDRDEPPPPKRVIEPKELFNVGGEMNLIPLELLIDVNSLTDMRK